MTKTMIGAVVSDAPLWNNATEAELLAIVASLSSASYHYADDRGKEWGKADASVAKAAAEVNRLRLSASAIRCLANHKPQLVTADAFMDAVLINARDAAAEAQVAECEREARICEALLRRGVLPEKWPDYFRVRAAGDELLAKEAAR